MKSRHSGFAVIAALMTFAAAPCHAQVRVWAWGYNGYGELGNGTITSSNVPVPVSGLANVVAVAGGGHHSLAVKQDGTVWAWGYNGYGELGNGTNTNSSVPVQVSGLANAVAVAGGYHHSLAIGTDAPAASLIKVSAAKAGVGQSAKLTATLQDTMTHVPLAGRDVQFSVDGVDTGGPVITSSKGQASLNYIVPESMGLGVHTLKASFAGDAAYQPSDASSTLTVTKGPVKLTVANVTGKAGSTVTLSAKLINASSVPLSGYTLSFSVAGSAVGNAATDSSGVATIGYTIPSSTAKGTYTITVAFAGNASHTPLTKSGKLTVK